MDGEKPPVLSSSAPRNSPSSVTEVTAEGCHGGQSARERVEEWRVLIHHFWKPLVSTLQPLPVFLKAKFCDPHSEALQGQLLDLHIQGRSREASEKLLHWLLDDQDNTPHDLLARWCLFKTALKDVHPVLHEVVFDNTYQPDILQHQRSLLNFFMEDIAQHVNPMHLLASFYSKQLMNVEHCEHLHALNEHHGQTLSAVYMVCNIHRLRSDWYEVFLELLMEKGYEHLVKDIDDKVYDKIMAKTGFVQESEISCAKEEAVLEVEEPAYEGRPKYYAAAPLAEGRDGGEVGRQREGTEFDAEETERKHVLFSAPPKWSFRTSPTEGESDDEDDNDEFHSCDEGEEIPDFTQLKMRGAWNDPSCRDKGSSQPGQPVWENQERAPGRKEFREKNILPMDEMASVSDNSNEEWVDPAAQEEVKEVQPEPLELRPYQEELAREGLQGKNVIIVAPTGSGKTHVALRLMENHLDQKGAGVRKVVFLVNQVALATQQYEACLKYLSRWRVKQVTGNSGVGSTEKVPLKHLVMRADILVMTAQILLNALGQREVEGIGEFSMVVLDECHHTNLLHPFNSIMHGYMDIKYTNANNHDSPPQPLPQVVGLTASVGVGKAGNEDQARKHIMKLCAHLDTDNICTVTHNTQELALHSNDPKYDQIICGKRAYDKFQEKIEDIMRIIETRMEKSEYLRSSGTEVLKEKLKLRPPVRGTVQYTGWVSELVKVIAMLDDAETRRYMDAGRCMLKFYNETLVINDECDTLEALAFLEKQLNEYDPLGKRTTDMERFLQELFDKNLPYLSSVSQQQRDTNPKLTALEDRMLKVFGEEPDSRAIVFVKTRDLASALLKWMLRRPDLKALKPGRMVGAGPSTDRGGMTKTQQVDVMEFFRSGDHKIMIATSVAEEGLDIRKCNLVIRYNHVSNEIAMVQARGRARAENSQFMTLASQNQGVQVKEEVNFIREMMMHEAIKKLQTEISSTPDRFRSELDQIQREEKSKRDAELAARSGRQLHQGEVVFRCRKCDAYAFVSSDVRKIEGIHHVVVDLEYRHRNIERIYPHPPKEYGNIQVRGRVLCKGCGENWGPILLFQNSKFPGTRLEGFLLTDEHGRKDVPKKWKQVQFTVSDLQPEELTCYREQAIAVDYIDLGD